MSPPHIYGKSKERLGGETPNSRATERRFWRFVELPASPSKIREIAVFVTHHLCWSGLVGGASVISATPAHASKNPPKNLTGSPIWTLIPSLLWSLMGSLSEVSK